MIPLRGVTMLWFTTVRYESFSSGESSVMTHVILSSYKLQLGIRIMIGRSEIVSGSKLTQNILEGIEIFLSKISQLRKVLKYSLDLATSNIRSILFCVWHFSPLGSAYFFIWIVMYWKQSKTRNSRDWNVPFDEIASGTTLKTPLFFAILGQKFQKVSKNTLEIP